MNRVNYKIGKNTISCLEVGKREQPMVLFLHGIPACAEIWRETMEKVSSKGFYCLAPDLSGYGLTEINETEYYSLLGNAKLLNQWLKEQNFGNIWLVAHDLGGAIAQIMITDNPLLFDKVTLSNVGTADTYPVPTIAKLVKASKMGLFYWLAIFGRFKTDKLYDSMKRFFVRNKTFSNNDFERIFFDGKFHKSKSIVKFQKMLTRLDNRYTVENMEKLKGIELPVHLIWAMNDKFQSWEISGKILESTFSNVRVSKIENCGHYLQIDANDEFVDTLLS
jgi:pimeloyl-ACP methyl ester carboxylesterase